jgi:hypothetical protein
MTGRDEYRLRCQLKDQQRYRPRDQSHLARIVGFRLGCTGLRGVAFFDISICTGNFL